MTRFKSISRRAAPALIKALTVGAEVGITLTHDGRFYRADLPANLFENDKTRFYLAFESEQKGADLFARLSRTGKIASMDEMPRLLSAALFVASIAAVPLLETTFIPADDGHQSSVVLELPPGTSLPETQAVAEDARQRIAAQVDHIRHWRVIEGSYETAPRDAGTYFVDPPYVEKGKYYRHRLSKEDYPRLAGWCLDLPGDVVVCEQHGANWLPFEPLATIKSTRGTSAEVVYLHTDRAVCAPFEGRARG
jgi:hypothetical protein